MKRMEWLFIAALTGTAVQAQTSIGNRVGVVLFDHMLKADEEVFLDGVTREEAEAALNTRIIPVASGEDLVEIVFSE